ncbi:anthrax toxin-like adenylyl cyclase domain-containing protein [Candidatus Regiella endosymbiont of Tuberolachnus salignus]|uniref:anthrax toxin-like adenylyl cyclase domain-containing protein n=1 Tax=Candidatus Regiella endosymbiont of Tuberolachnus salignus TaxID=3077956 RepID=UPI0030D0AE0F
MSIIHFGCNPMPNYYAVDSVTMDSMNNVAHLEEQQNSYTKKIFTPYFFSITEPEGKEAIKAAGIVDQHVYGFAELAKKENVYFIFRPVNSLSTSLIYNGMATKGLDVHGKSSDWGPMAGYIPFDQNLSKMFGNQYAVNKGNEENRRALEEKSDRFAKKQLYITSERLDALQREKILEWDVETLEITPLHHEGADSYQFRLRPHQNGYLVEYRKFNTITWLKLELMGKKVNNEIKPLTADYDLFMVAPNITNVIHPDKVSQVLDTDTGKFENLAVLLCREALSQENRRKVDPEIGRAPTWMPYYIDKLNEKAKERGYSGGNVVNHSSEMDNPMPEFNQSLFFITPKGKILLTQNWQETQDVIDYIKKDNYVVYSNRNYNSLFITEDINGNQKVSIIPWGDSLPLLKEFDNYTESIKKIKGSEIISNDLKMIRKKLEDYHNKKIVNKQIKKKIIYSIIEQLEKMLLDYREQYTNLAFALEGLYQRIIIYVNRMLNDSSQKSASQRKYIGVENMGCLI